ncbi:MAG: 50S ribosomal protein L35 [Deltaproteobacteria bacterium]|nr:50S ribosomal protein L35 [Deltaproteobacteria bacterium]
MPKLKTNRAAHKRFKKTGSGKFRRSSAFYRHILTSKSKKTKRQLRRGAMVHETNQAEIRRLLPYG